MLWCGKVSEVSHAFICTFFFFFFLRYDLDLALMNMNVYLQCFALGMITCLFDLNMLCLRFGDDICLIVRCHGYDVMRCMMDVC